MDNIKPIIIAVVFSIVGIVFIAAGIHFLSAKYLNLLTEYQSSADRCRQNDARRLGKACGFFSIATGFLTILCGIVMALQPDILMYVAIIYIAILFIGTACMLFVIKTGSRK